MTKSIPSTVADPSDLPVDATEMVRELGFKPIRAWVPDGNMQEETSGALRTRRCREKAKQLGLKQLSVTLPVELHPILKVLAARTKAGEPPATVLAELMPALSLTDGDTADAKPDASFVPLETLPAWRRWLLRWLLPRNCQLKRVEGMREREAIAT